MTLLEAAKQYVNDLERELTKMEDMHVHSALDFGDDTCPAAVQILVITRKLEMIRNAIKNSESSSEK